MTNLLIVEGNTREAREQTTASGALTQSELYKKTLLSLRPGLHCDVVYPADEGTDLPDDDSLAGYDGIIWTGSALNIYDQNPAITKQIEFMKKCFALPVKIFGSCWGLQVAVVAAGGVVSRNDKGREIGIARDIKLTDSGQTHPLYKDKTGPFDAVAIHLDHVIKLPEGTTVLSGNGMSQVQAVEIRNGPAIFWGVQYHPEFDLDYIASLMEKYKKRMVEEGFCPDEAAVEQLSSEYRLAQTDGQHKELREKYDMGPDVLDPCCRLREISNWLDFIDSPAS
ncbi:type 1 glutamine amidotransferase [Emcibacter sp.]|uniref:type 1 glutamine amidotransferase n=1 Tax=Emcibacter sp. TaxID=1979954 RepID=UPI002AA932B2|nr:type 1 glutamine amidotransferase [Emcibacter sp.]